MNPVPDRTKMRREYLRKKAKAYSKVTVGSVLFPVAVTGTVVCAGMAALYFLALQNELAYQNADILRLKAGIERGVMWTFAILAALSARVAWISGQMVMEARREVRVPHVPPVRPTSLPAEEVLVRGASEPSAPNETLLRAAVKGEEAHTAELLRIDSR
jgi:hypothetical protein